MDLIKKAAHLEVCSDCGNHAQIAFSDGNFSRNFGTIIRGLLILGVALQAGAVTEEEYGYIRREIYASPLPVEDALADAMVDLVYNGEGEGDEDVEPEASFDKTDALILKMMFGPHPSNETTHND